MHVARGGWLGQTYALAKFDDSFEGKKSGVRRSKEERKGMIETFIKRYRSSNNGDFPSLNLTRKEVGGSFYTVREIVREIIQENRVLGPAKSSPGDKNMENLDSFLEHHPLDSMPVDLHVPLIHTNETQNQPEYVFINEKVTNEAFENLKNTELIMEGSTGKQKDEVHGIVANETQIHKILEVKDIDGNLEVDIEHPLKESKSTLESQTGQDASSTNENLVFDVNDRTDIGDIVANATQNHHVLKDADKNLEEEMTHPLKESKSTLAGQKGHDPSSTKENLVFDGNGSTNVELEDTLLAEQKTINGANAQNLQNKTSCNSVQELTFDERSANLNQSSGQPGASSPDRRTNSTLHRVDLKSWKAASKKGGGRETQQLVKFIRSFVTTFVKFWSE